MWTQQDSLDAPLDPVNANRYAYAGADPINNYDPTGLYSWEDAVGDLSGAGITALIAVPGIAFGGPVGAIGGAALGGCLGGMTSEAVTARLKGEESEVGLDDLGLRCGVGAVTGSLGG